MKKKPAFRRKKRNKATIALGVTVVTVFAVVILYSSINLFRTREALRVQAETLQMQVDQENERTRELEEYETYTHTKKFAEETAKEVLGYVYDDEIVFKADE